MARMFAVCAVSLVAAFLRADEKPAESTETVIRLTVAPMAEPRPVLKYQLLPQMTEMQAGNPIQGYLRCFCEQQNFFYNREVVMKREEYQKMPLAKLPVKELKDYGRLALDQADYAARLDAPDWQMLYKMRRDGARLLLPDLQGMRDLTRALKVRYRVAIAEKNFDAGIRTAKTMFAMSRHLGQHPSLIGNLVAMAVANETIGTLEEMLQQQGCPNLYWALTELPSPLVEIRYGILAERLLVPTELARISDRRPMGAAELEQIVKSVDELYDSMNLKEALYPPNAPPLPKGNQPNKGEEKRLTPREWLAANAGDATRVRAARQRLVDAGMNEKTAASLPGLQIILLDEKRELDDRRDENLKGMLLPYWQGEAFLVAKRKKRNNQGECLFRFLVPVCTKIRNNQARLDQRVAMVRTLEALRLYAAAHAGRLPDKLAELGVPVPVDSVTGKPFGYVKEGNKATLKGGTPVGQQSNPYFNARYEVTIKP
jgi:hypothetical protein